MSFDKKKLVNYPSSAGVYLMKDGQGKVLYVGKAKNLKSRLRQYFSASDERQTIAHLVPQITDIETIVVSSEKEALLLENTLIKRHKPKYNVLLKDDKSYICIELTSHPYPKLQLTRVTHKTNKKRGQLFGPYTNARAAKDMLDLIFEVFPLRQCSDHEFMNRTRPCILYDIKRCLGPCVNKCTKKEYTDAVGEAKEFLKGHNKKILNNLKTQMQKASDKMEYEKAHDIHMMIKRIEHALKQQHVYSFDKTSSDAIGIYQEGFTTLITILGFENGQLTSSKHFSFFENLASKQELLPTFLLQHYQAKQKLPENILLPFSIEGQKKIEEILNDSALNHTHLLTPQKGHKHKLVSLAKQNALSLYHQEKDKRFSHDKVLVALQETFRLNNFPNIIECIDLSNLSTKDNVAAVVRFTHGAKDSAFTRYYKAKTDEVGDVPLLKHCLYRHLKRQKQKMAFADLLLIDGGKAHINAASDVLNDLGIISIDLMAISKEQGRHDKGLTHEKIHLLDKKEPILLAKNSPILFFLQSIRDQAHHTAIHLQRKQRSKKVSSALEEIEGIGPKKQKALLKHFKSIERIKNASKTELEAIKGISKKNAASIIKFFAKKNLKL